MVKSQERSNSPARRGVWSGAVRQVRDQPQEDPDGLDRGAHLVKERQLQVAQPGRRSCLLNLGQELIPPALRDLVDVLHDVDLLGHDADRRSGDGEPERFQQVRQPLHLLTRHVQWALLVPEDNRQRQLNLQGAGASLARLEILAKVWRV